MNRAKEIIESLETISRLMKPDGFVDLVIKSDVTPIIEQLCQKIESLEKANEWQLFTVLPPLRQVNVKDKFGRYAIVDFSKCDEIDIIDIANEMSLTHWKPIK